MLEKALDKSVFTFAIANICITEYILLYHAQQFYLWYACWIFPLLLWRCVAYTAIKEQYFLLDYCYFVNALVWCHLFLFPESPVAFQAAFLSCVGPIGWAVVVWRNSLVFHSVDKVGIWTVNPA
jgi:hypothetical protein